LNPIYGSELGPEKALLPGSKIEFSVTTRLKNNKPMQANTLLESHGKPFTRV